MPQLLLHHARLIDGTGAPAVPDAAVLISDDRIGWAGPAKSAPKPDGATRLDLGGHDLPRLLRLPRPPLAARQQRQRAGPPADAGVLSVQAGKLADIVVVRGDPLDDIDSVGEADNILLVLKEGRVVKDGMTSE